MILLRVWAPLKARTKNMETGAAVHSQERNIRPAGPGKYNSHFVCMLSVLSAFNNS